MTEENVTVDGEEVKGADVAADEIEEGTEEAAE